MYVMDYSSLSVLGASNGYEWDFLSTSAGTLVGPPAMNILDVPAGADVTIRFRTGLVGNVSPEQRRRYFDLTYRHDPPDLTVLSVTELPAGMDCPDAPRGITCTRLGSPRWNATDWSVFATPIGDTTVVEQVLPLHRMWTDATGLNLFGPDPTQPHAGPYEGELSDGVVAAGFSSDAAFTVDDFRAPRSVFFMNLFVPTADAPSGSSPDFAEGPIWGATWHPFHVDGELRKEGAVIDLQFDTMYPPISMLPIAADGYSHMVMSWWDNDDYFAAEPGSYELYFHMLDATFNGWDVAIPFTIE